MREEKKKEPLRKKEEIVVWRVGLYITDTSKGLFLHRWKERVVTGKGGSKEVAQEKRHLLTDFLVHYQFSKIRMLEELGFLSKC